MLEAVHGTQEPRDFLLAQHDGQLLGLAAGGDVVLDNPGPFEGDGEEETKRGDRDDDRAGRKAPLLRQMDQIGPDLSRPQEFG